MFLFIQVRNFGQSNYLQKYQHFFQINQFKSMTARDQSLSQSKIKGFIKPYHQDFTFKFVTQANQIIYKALHFFQINQFNYSMTASDQKLLQSKIKGFIKPYHQDFHIQVRHFGQNKSFKDSPIYFHQNFPDREHDQSLLRSKTKQVSIIS